MVQTALYVDQYEFVRISALIYTAVPRGPTVGLDKVTLGFGAVRRSRTSPEGGTK